MLDTISPSFGPASGDQLVMVMFTVHTIIHTIQVMGNFSDPFGTYKCRFGSENPIVSGTRINATVMQCITPATKNGTVTVQTSVGFGFHDTRPDYTFLRMFYCNPGILNQASWT